MKAYLSMVVELLMEKAQRFIDSAHLLAEHGDFDGSASRLYYAMFFVAQALLETKGLSFSSHKAVQAACGLHFAKTRELDPRFHHALLFAFQQRQLGDYSVTSHVTAGVVEDMTRDAEGFLASARDRLAARPPSG